MDHLSLDIRRVLPFIPERDLLKMETEFKIAQKTLYDGTGAGNDFLGWLHLPSEITDEQLTEIERDADELRKKSEILVVVGIGGSYLGAKAVNDALTHNFSNLFKSGPPLMLFAGHNIGEDYMHELLDILDTHSYSIVVISKSGTTTEPALAFRILKDHLVGKVGLQEAAERIIAITDSSKGALRQLAFEEGYRTYAIPDNVGGRYSVLTPVGLVPLAVCGIDIHQLVKGARVMARMCSPGIDMMKNPAALYAVIRNALYRSGKKIEILVNYHNKLHFFSEWWKQLYGESEGKEGRGLFPAAVDNSTDLHSMGQYIQEGERILFETVISVDRQQHDVTIPHDRKNLDRLNYLAGKHMDHVNKMAELGTAIAHIDGGVPNIRIGIPELNAHFLGQLIYFFENACGISGYLLGINPFDQPGVEAYKKNMFALLEKPGFEEDTKRIKKKL
ncbi:MAG: glucose-6-phosphate isomerase [Bacteroidales bacterium]|nr:glucose-6-phosphate isomerase [Bacteroidales bacterium]MBN2699608.1 glucose-6-phosphate isomerase [Bacteroidales bacterium]